MKSVVVYQAVFKGQSCGHDHTVQLRAIECLVKYHWVIGGDIITIRKA